MWLIGLPALGLYLYYLQRRNYHPGVILIRALFGLYLLFLIRGTLFPIPVSGYYADILRQRWEFPTRINLIPLDFGTSIYYRSIIFGIRCSLFLFPTDCQPI